MDQTVLRIALSSDFEVFEEQSRNGSEIIVSGGYEYDFLKMVTQSLGYPYKIILPGDNEYGHKNKNGTWTGLMGLLEKDEADMSIGHIYLLPDRQEFSYSYPYNEAKLTFATRHPEEIHSPASLLHVFEYNVWICLAATIFTMVAVFMAILSGNHKLTDLFFRIFSSLLQQGTSFKVRGLRDSVLIAHWIISAAFISFIYSSVLLSFLTVPVKEKGVKDFKDLLVASESGIMKSFTLDEEDVLSALSTSSDPTTRTLFTMISERGWHIPYDFGVIRKTVFSEKNAFIENKKQLELMFGSKAFISDDSVMNYPIVIVLQKNSKFHNRLDKIIHRIVASGVVKKMFDHYLLKLNPELYWFKPVTEGAKKLTFYHLSGAFWLLAAGLALAFFVLLVEIAVSSLWLRIPIVTQPLLSEIMFDS